ncbi:hypothetical protein ACLOJK_002759 [Asimina triloba]
MEKSMGVLITMLLCLISVAAAVRGTAVFYNPPYTPSACYQYQNKGAMVAGVSDALWDRGRACGRRYSVRCTGPTNTAPHPCKANRVVTVTVVDYCRAPCNGIIDLSRDAFNVIADPNAGNVQIDYRQYVNVNEIS